MRGAETAEPSDVPVRSRPLSGVPEVVSTPQQLRALADRLAAGSGPVAVDTERAQSFRYTGRAYLLQLARTGCGIALVDPLGLTEPDLRLLRAAIIGAEWIIHAATQDLPCLAELGLLPQQLFDTELAARLLGYPRVALGTLTESLLGVRLLKKHSAADWSKRPLPPDWLAYAALDVELLGQLRDRLAAELESTGKAAWASQEFEYLVAQAGLPATARPDPWRRLSGIHTVRTPLGMAVARELWTERDRIARELDRAPSRLLGDEGIVTLAGQIKRLPARVDRSVLRAIPRFNRREARRYESAWLEAAQRALALPRSQWPATTVPSEGPPPPRTWPNRDPAAAARWERVRPELVRLAEQHGLPVENLVTPDSLRRLLWQPVGSSPAELDAQLADYGLRPWQRELVVPVVAAALEEPST
ncbi:MAG: ribonuclease D [Actinomycetia bacterium]|nr:ribonuclease D [Actinomycetes bacterium]